METTSQVNLHKQASYKKALTTSEKATERDPRRMQKAAPYLPSTNVDIKVQESAPRSPDKTRYDLLRYPKRGKESLQGQKIFMRSY